MNTDEERKSPGEGQQLEVSAHLRELENRIAKLEAVEDIKRLQARYASALDDGYNPDKLVELFAPDGVWDGGPQLGRFEGRTALYHHYVNARSNFRWSAHFMMSPNIQVAPGGDVATGSWYLLEASTSNSGGCEEQYWIGTVFDIRYVRDATGWKFKEVRLRVTMSAPFETGWGSDGLGGGAAVSG
jgi:hypothetical protein